ncbi:MAG: PilZ domain-containing protein [Thermoanaerobaculia bacterium]
MKRPDLRTVARYFLAPPLAGFANGRAVRIIDLSIKGARIDLVEQFNPGEDVFLVIVSSQGEITVPGTILWCELDSLLLDNVQDRYLAGVSFSHSSAAIDALLDELCGTDHAHRIEDFRDHDRYRVTAPLTGSFGDLAPVSVLDLSIRGGRISSEGRIPVGTGGQLRFQVDDENGPTDVYAKVMWTTPAIAGGEQAGLLVNGEDEAMRQAIHRLCVRGEARIDLDSLRRKFDQMRAQSVRQQVTG